ncbi:Lrp/AsnC family transcriptional regulator [Candidatus Woesearchaeota archaeon]|nr:Lrp/AsnC family transcriptional regulator [Candidatus Woesearchaeota archaeon]
MRDFDEKDGIILNILQDNCRTSLTEISKKVDLSIDSVKKRIRKMENVIFHPRIQIRPRSLGFSNIVDVKIKLSNHSKEEIDSFIKYLQDHPRIAEAFSVSGEWDLSIVIISRDADELDNITSSIKSKFGKIIGSWCESTTLKAYKFEKYDMERLLASDLNKK